MLVTVVSQFSSVDVDLVRVNSLIRLFLLAFCLKVTLVSDIFSYKQ